MRSQNQGSAPSLRLLLLTFLLLSGCVPSSGLNEQSPASPTPISSPPTLPTPTPFQPASPSPTPAVVEVWLSPAVPPQLRSPIERIAQDEQAGITLVGEADQAKVRFEVNAEVNLTTWVYAFCAPFHTVQDSGSLEGLRLLWSGGGDPAIQISAAPDTIAALSPLLGEPASGVVQITPQEDMIDQVWGRAYHYALVPFHELEPRWKVLSLEGMSPLAKDLNLETYPLVAQFGVSGDPASVMKVMDRVRWPESNRDPERMSVVLITGVTALTRTTAAKMDENGMTYPGELIRAWLQEPDFTHVSSEAAFTETCPAPDPYQVDLRFCSSPRHLELLDYVGVDLIELTGNHVLDWGTQALLESLAYFRQRGWHYFGGGDTLEIALNALTLEHHGNRFAFLGCNAAGPDDVYASANAPGATPCGNERLFEQLGALREDGYLTIFTFQWAEGAALLPAQVEAFRAAVDAGALIVSGSQAHQPMPMEFYGDGFIHYGLGNLFFDQMQSLALRQEFLDRHVFYAGRHISTELLTAILEDYAQPRPMTPEERELFLAQMFAASGW